MLDADIRWDSASGSVEIAGSPQTGASDVTITVGVPESSKTENAPQTREFGQVVGPFEEIDPKTIETVLAENPSPIIHMKDAHIQTEMFSFPPLVVTVAPVHGQYLVYAVTNNGTSDATSVVFRKPTVTYGRAEMFPRVTVAPGETLVRAFKVADGANPLTYELQFAFNCGGPEGPGATDMTVSLEQYS